MHSTFLFIGLALSIFYEGFKLQSLFKAGVKISNDFESRIFLFFLGVIYIGTILILLSSPKMWAMISGAFLVCLGFIMGSKLIPKSIRRTYEIVDRTLCILTLIFCAIKVVVTQCTL